MASFVHSAFSQSRYLDLIPFYRAIARKVWGMNIGRIETGAKADLILVDYFRPTPLRREDIPGHLLSGISSAPIDSLIVNEPYIVQNKQCITMDERAVAENAAIQTRPLTGHSPGADSRPGLGARGDIGRASCCPSVGEDGGELLLPQLE
jgi:hypothetical protein